MLIKFGHERFIKRPRKKKPGKNGEIEDETDAHELGPFIQREIFTAEERETDPRCDAYEQKTDSDPD